MLLALLDFKCRDSSISRALSLDFVVLEPVFEHFVDEVGLAMREDEEWLIVIVEDLLEYFLILDEIYEIDEEFIVGVLFVGREDNQNLVTESEKNHF